MMIDTDDLLLALVLVAAVAALCFDRVKLAAGFIGVVIGSLVT